MTISDATLLTDSILMLRSIISSGTTDPISASRSTDSKFVTTHYPERPTEFPFIVLSDDSISDERLGAGIEASKVNLTFKIDIFAKSIGYGTSGRDKVWNDLYDALRTNQLGKTPVSGTHHIGLHDFKLLNTFNLDEPGIEGIHRKVARVQYSYFTS